MPPDLILHQELNVEPRKIHGLNKLCFSRSSFVLQNDGCNNDDQSHSEGSLLLSIHNHDNGIGFSAPGQKAYEDVFISCRQPSSQPAYNKFLCVTSDKT